MFVVGIGFVVSIGENICHSLLASIALHRSAVAKYCSTFVYSTLLDAICTPILYLYMNVCGYICTCVHLIFKRSKRIFIYICIRMYLFQYCTLTARNRLKNKYLVFRFHISLSGCPFASIVNSTFRKKETFATLTN